jgi:hypothetical protein
LGCLNARWAISITPEIILREPVLARSADQKAVPLFFAGSTWDCMKNFFPWRIMAVKSAFAKGFN